MAALAPGSDFDVRRFRPTILMDSPDHPGQPELSWCGGLLRGPDITVNPLIPTIRCVMPSHEQPGLGRDPVITRTVAAHARRCLGVYGTVAGPGRISEGDILHLNPPQRPSVVSGAGTAVKRAVMRAVSAVLPRGS